MKNLTCESTPSQKLIDEIKGYNCPPETLCALTGIADEEIEQAKNGTEEQHVYDALLGFAEFLREMQRNAAKRNALMQLLNKGATQQ
jgi:hypothetical protein